MKASILLVTYQQHATVARAIESLLHQDFDDSYEIIVADDGSTDGTRELLQEYYSRHPHKIRLMPCQPNKGVVDNYFDAMATCRGRYIADCAGDDYWPDCTRLRRQCDMLDSHPNAVIAIGDWQQQQISCDRPHPPKPRIGIPPPGEHNAKLWLRFLLGTSHPLPIHLSACMWRKSALCEADLAPYGLVRNKNVGCEDLPLLAYLLSRPDATAIYEPSHTEMIYTLGSDMSLAHPNDLSLRGRSYLTAARFHIRAAEAYGVDPYHIYRAIKVKLTYAMSCARHAHDADLRRDICALADRLPYWLGPRFSTLRLLAHLQQLT